MKTSITADIDLYDVKKLYSKFDIKFNCPHCNQDNIYKFDHYLSYIRVGDTIDFDMYCDECDEFFTVPLTVKSAKIQLDIDLS